MRALEVLAARYGIEESFRDARGMVQMTTPATRQALLAAMGVSANTEEAALAALDALDREEWLRPLPAVHVALESAPVTVPITYPAGTGTLTWRLFLEGGAEKCGEVRFERLQLLHRRDIDDKSYEKRALLLEIEIPCGYHRLALMPGDAESTLIATPGKCWLPPDIEQGKRLWGIAAQLYLLKSHTNWGIGDYADLSQLAHLLVGSGAQAIGLNPLHAMFVDDPEHASPYSPASRLLLNVLNIDVAAVPEVRSQPALSELIASDLFQTRIDACRSKHLVDYRAVTELKLSILEKIFAAGRSPAGHSLGSAFEQFRRERGETLERHCLFLALREHF